MSRNISRLVLALVGGMLISSTAAAQRMPAMEYSANAATASSTLSAEARRAMQERIEAINAKFRASHGGLGPEQFGLQCCQITQFPALGFVPIGSAWSYPLANAYGYMYQTAGAFQAYVLANVSLPTGVEIKYIDLYYDDPNAADDIKAQLLSFSGGGPFSGPPSQDVVGEVSSSGSSGYGYAATSLTYTVNNNVAYDANAAQLVLSVVSDFPPGDADLGFKAVDLWWMRQISPAPGTATFSDVPTNHQFFQFVEALAASGITVGYPDGRFGVDDSITRGQMAVFLAKALGLYWPF